MGEIKYGYKNNSKKTFCVYDSNGQLIAEFQLKQAAREYVDYLNNKTRFHMREIQS